MATQKRVLITGINGFTGHYVAEELRAHGWEVWGTGSQPLISAPHYYQAELTNLPALKDVVRKIRPHAVVHLAAIAFVAHGDPNDFYQVNLLGTRNLLEALAACDVLPESILLASSANVYGNAKTGSLSESDSANPANDYAVSKLAMEYMASLWRGKLPIFVTRPFNYTGVGQTENFLIPKIVAHFLQKAPQIELGNIDVSRDFSDVRVVASVYRKLLEVAPVGETINVCSGTPCSLRDVLSMAEDITGHYIDVRVNPAFVRENEVKTLVGDSSKLLSIIPEFKAITLRDTLKWMLKVNV